MKISINKQALLSGSGAVAIAASAMLIVPPASPVFAQGNDAQGNHDLEETHSDGHRVEMHEIDFEDGGMFGYLAEEQMMANALGLTEEELEDAYKKAFDLALDQAVADGELTQAQADEIKGAEKNGTEKNGTEENGEEVAHFMLDGFVSNDEIKTYLAQALEMSQADFDAALDGAIQKAADDGLITQAQANDMLLEKLIEEKMDDAFKQALDEGVSQGLITQSQADRMKEGSMSGFGQEEEIDMEPFGFDPGEFGPFGFGPGGFGPDGMHEECFEYSGPGGFEHDFEGGFEDFEFFEGPGGSRGGWFRMPNFNPFR